MTTISNKDLKLKVIEIYNSKIKKNLEVYAFEISDIFEYIFESKLEDPSNNYSLTHTNAGYLGKYYKISPRVKNGLSLGEKLIKKDDLLKLKYTVDFNGEKEIEHYLMDRYTDLIGIKVLGDLKHDTINIFNLIKDYKNKFQDVSNPERYITFESLNNRNDKMKNGMEIIKVDCIYHRDGQRYKFELQVKSQLMSAWGDMEHQQFYKNNRFSLVRKSNESIMSDVGNLLEKTDDLLLTIRTSENKYSENEELWKFTVDIQNDFSDKLNKILDVNVDSQLTEIADFLLVLFKRIKPKRRNCKSDLDILRLLKEGELDSEESDELFISNYIAHRKTNFKLQILEIITLIWYNSLGKMTYSKENYSTFVKNYIKELLDIIQKEYDINVNDEVKFEKIFYELLIYSKKCEIFRDIKYYKNIVLYYNFTKDTYLEMRDEEEVFTIEVFYLINNLFARNEINGESIEDITFKQVELPNLTLIDSFFEYLKNEAKSSNQYSEFIDVSNRIHLRLRGE